MEKQNLITKAIGLIGIKKLASVCGITRQGILRWEANGRVPSSDFVWKTNYCDIIEAETNHEITRKELLNPENIVPLP
jgi:transcriptional regulator with XRE-family HTH domain